MEEHVRVIEIGGVKVEVDLRSAKRVDTFRVGDRVKVLVKEYSVYRTYHGAIVAFDEFKALPSITVCYINDYGAVHFAVINSESKDIEMVTDTDATLPVEKASVVEKLTNEIAKKQAELDDAKSKLRYFLEKFGSLFGEDVPEGK